MARALLDTADGSYYHPECRDADDSTLETVEETGIVCEKCGGAIEDDEDPTTIEDEEEGKEGDK